MQMSERCLIELLIAYENADLLFIKLGHSVAHTIILQKKSMVKFGKINTSLSTVYLYCFIM